MTREELIVEHYARVRQIAAQVMRANRPRGLDYGDLVSVGVIGLIDAIDRYDPQRNACLDTFLKYRVRGAMQDLIRDQCGRGGARASRKMALQLEPSFFARLQGSFPSPEQKCIADNALEVLAAGLKELPARERLILRELYWDETITDDIAAGMGLSQSRITQVKFIALKRLRAYLTERPHEGFRSLRAYLATRRS